MSLRDALHQRQKRGKRALLLASERMKARIQDTVTGSRRDFRAQPTSLPVSAHDDPEQARDITPPGKARTGIVSVNGQDVGKVRCTGH